MNANAAGVVVPPPKLPALRLTNDGDVSYAASGRAVPWVASPTADQSLQQQQEQLLRLSQLGQTEPSRDQDPDVPRLTMEGPSPLSVENVRRGEMDGFNFGVGFEDGGLLSSRSEVPPPDGSRDSIPPPFARASTMPLTPQLDQLQHPYRTTGRSSPGVTVDCQIPHVKELSHELADSIQMIVQTLLQISPAQVLDPGKEQFTACSLSVPTSSMSAMFTVMKNINYLSANMSSYFGEPAPMSGRRAEKQPMQDDTPTPPLDCIEFDVGETLQAVGDSLSGCAAQAGVDLVLYHGDVSLKHVSVFGDEASLRYAITQVIQQVLNTAERGDSVELGLLLTPISEEGVPQQLSHDDPQNSNPSNEGEDPVSDTVPDVPLQCTIRIAHKFAFPERGEGDPFGPEPKQTRLSPNLSTISIRQILRHTSSTLRGDLPPPPNFPTGRTIELEFPLRRSRSSFLSPLSQISDANSTQHDATLQHLITFAETLKGKRATLYASAKGSFAQHLTSYLTAWGMVVGHVTPDGAVDGVTDLPPTSPGPHGRYSNLTGRAALLALAGKLEPSKMQGVVSDAEGRKPISFILIDDDIEILKERLQALRQDQAPASYLDSVKRPTLASLHRPRSTNQVPFASAQATLPSRIPPPLVILHFTSLSNYKHLKETVQSIVATYAGTTVPVPEVMIIPKPAGPRRLLAALYTAVTKPTVDPQFSPIATSPMSPGVSATSPFFGGSISTNTVATKPETSPRASTLPKPLSPVIKPVRPAGTRTNSDRSTKPPRETPETPAAIPPSPLTLPDNIEYFSAAAQKLGTTPSSGFVIQSPDGQPAGILFRPNLKARGSRLSPRALAAPSMERDDQGRQTPVGARRGSIARVAPSKMLDFRALHAANGLPSGPVPSSSAPPLTTSSEPPSATHTPIPLPVPPTVLEALGGSSPVVVSATSPVIPVTATTRKSSLGPKTQSPPGSPPADGSSQTTTTATRRQASRKASSQSEKDGNTAPTSISTVKKSKLGESHIIPPISVLIVDDNPINQTILSTFMRRKKIKYDIANNGAEAVQKWRTGGFHLILMDIQMPIMDGIEATKEIRRLEKSSANSGFPQLTPITEGQRTPSDTSEPRSAASPYRSSVIIVALTASSLQSDRVAALAAGCNDFLTKPVSLLWLNNKIIEWGSIKALQMWADLRPEIVRSMNTGQAVQARAVADNLHMPPRKKTPSPKRSSSLKEEQEAAIALASTTPGGQIPPAVQKAIAEARSRSNSRLTLDSSPTPVMSRQTSPDSVAELRRRFPPPPPPPIPAPNGASRKYVNGQVASGSSTAIPPKQEAAAVPLQNGDHVTLSQVPNTSQDTITPEQVAVEATNGEPHPPPAPGLGNQVRLREDQQ